MRIFVSNRSCNFLAALPRLSRVILFAMLFHGLGASTVFAHDAKHGEVAAAAPSKEANLVELAVPDLEVVNQDGRKGRLISDFIGERLVAFTFVYTTCTTICPVIDSIFLNVQKRIASDFGNEFALLTLTIDSAIDIPARLKEHTEKLGIKPGWDFLTGERDAVIQILKALEVYTPDIANHPPVIFIVDGLKGEWYRLNGFTSPGRIEETLRRRLANR